MIIEVDPASPVPVYAQITDQVTRMVESGVLEPGTRLPTIRQLAGDLGLAKGTVAKAYESLLHRGMVRSGGRRGTVVAPRVRLATAEVDDSLARAARDYALRASQLGASPGTAQDAVRRAFDDLGSVESHPAG